MTTKSYRLTIKGSRVAIASDGPMDYGSYLEAAYPGYTATDLATMNWRKMKKLRRKRLLRMISSWQVAHDPARTTLATHAKEPHDG